MEPTVQTQGLPAPSGAPSAAPAAPAATPVAATPAIVAHGSDSTSSPVSAEAAASNAAQLAAAEPVEAPAPAAAPVSVSTTGVEAFDQVGRMLAEKGVANSNDILSAAANGELSLADKAAMVTALGPDIANLAISQMEGEVSKQRALGTEQASSQQAYADKVLGGKEGSWEALRAFINTPEAGFSDADKTAISEMIAEGGVKGEWAIDQMAARYQKSQGFNVVPSLLSGDGPTTVGFEPLSKGEYASSMRDAQNKFGEGSREVESLRVRRTESIRRGF